jgi:hypothetical protein
VPKSKIVDQIVSEKIGCMGVFTVRQPGWGKNREGYGEWKGVVLSSNVKIELDGPVCKMITVSNLKNKMELGKHLHELIKNISAQYPDTYSDSDHWLSSEGVINGGKGLMKAIPIELDSELIVTIFDDVLDWDWFFDIHYNSLRLRADSGKGNIITLISDTFKSHEWDPIYTMDVPMFRSWNNSEPINAEEISSELSHYFNKNDAHTFKELKMIMDRDSKSVSSSGWKLKNFRSSLKSFFALQFSEKKIPEMKESLSPIDEIINDEDLLFFQTGDYEMDHILANELICDKEEDNFEFDADFSVESYLEDHLELLLTEREVSHQTNQSTMPPTNRCLTSLDGLSRALTGKSLRELYQDCIIDDSKRFYGLMGKIMTLLTETPRVSRNISDIERDAFRQEEEATSATLSLRTMEDLGNLNEEEIKANIDEIDQMLIHARQPGIKENLQQTRIRYLHMLNLIDIKDGNSSVSAIPSRDIILWLRDESGYFSKETNLLYRLTDSAYILSLRDRLDSHVETMCSKAIISEFELGLYREAIPKPHLTTMFLDVFANYLGINLQVGPYCTNSEGDVNYVFDTSRYGS